MVQGVARAYVVTDRQHVAAEAETFKAHTLLVPSRAAGPEDASLDLFERAQAALASLRSRGEVYDAALVVIRTRAPLDPESLQKLVKPLAEDPHSRRDSNPSADSIVGTALARIVSGENVAEVSSPSRVKVIMDMQGRALMCSRAIIPTSPTGKPVPGTPYLVLLPAYTVRASFLEDYVRLPKTLTVLAEGLEVNKAILAGSFFKICITSTAPDSPASMRLSASGAAAGASASVTPLPGSAALPPSVLQQAMAAGSAQRSPAVSSPGMRPSPAPSSPGGSKAANTPAAVSVLASPALSRQVSTSGGSLGVMPRTPSFAHGYTQPKVSNNGMLPMGEAGPRVSGGAVGAATVPMGGGGGGGGASGSLPPRPAPGPTPQQQLELLQRQAMQLMGQLKGAPGPGPAVGMAGPSPLGMNSFMNPSMVPPGTPTPPRPNGMNGYGGR
jgi:hypothetical protein